MTSEATWGPPKCGAAKPVFPVGTAARRDGLGRQQSMIMEGDLRRHGRPAARIAVLASGAIADEAGGAPMLTASIGAITGSNRGAQVTAGVRGNQPPLLAAELFTADRPVAGTRE